MSRLGGGWGEVAIWVLFMVSLMPVSKLENLFLCYEEIQR